MIAVVCVDEKNGMLFNRRRVSRDRIQQEDLLRLCGEKKLWISGFSAKLFEPFAEKVFVDEAFLQIAGMGEFCFVEDQPLQPWLDRLEGVIVYRWNRAYPSDQVFDLDLTGFTCQEKLEFAGSSHERITREIYSKK